MRDVKPLATEDPFDIEMHSVLSATLRGGEVNYYRGLWEVYQKFNESLEVWYAGRRVWKLWLGGECQPRALPCLKAALVEAGVREEFWGGRGVTPFEYGGLVYTNHQSTPDEEWLKGVDFIEGFETVRESSTFAPPPPGMQPAQGPKAGVPILGKLLGWHRYFAKRCF